MNMLHRTLTLQSHVLAELVHLVFLGRALPHPQFMCLQGIDKHNNNTIITITITIIIDLLMAWPLLPRN